MRKVFKVFKFEIYKTVKNKFLMISFCVFFVLFLLILINFAYSFPLAEASAELTEREKAELSQSYEEKREYNGIVLSYLSGEIANLPQGVILIPGGDYQKEYDYYDFLLKNNTFESDYLGKHAQSFGVEHQGLYVMMYVINTLGILLPIVAILVAFYVFCCDFTGGKIKNLIAASERKNICLGKTLFLCLVILVIFLAAIAYPLYIGARDSSATLLLYGESGYYAQPAFLHLFLPHAWALLLSMLFYASVSAAFGQLLVSRFGGLIMPLLVFGVLQLLYAAYYSVFYVSELFKIMPLSFIRYGELSLIIEYFVSFSTGQLYLTLATLFCVTFSVLCAILPARKIAKRDF